ncbi:Fungal Zn(2)-Cys(6) binuclear cluster domain-containing protein [Penicillium ucsense]|uniref:Fungal Zn(2)-Cys(6) binuclear cluster domain-containing protein n=1 Tax=Penicillium ucsense TaxID=2839758 RepID=A0A8J8W7C4_9EURO|nr:Fungal Zn(2)-Cys(6) binuclear cluster domain-containing protein [Penicillium ucsense]KAF7735582.1 Fungal Zn(2)-Cys(6) binuclear cluster domain-containing protein [Penicillium ucsense]
MRSSLSCEFCRRSKIKCVNTGKAPCRKCQRSGILDCTLSRPQSRPLSRPHRRPDQARAVDSHEIASSSPCGLSHEPVLNRRPISGIPSQDAGIVQGQASAHAGHENATHEHIRTLSPSIVLKVLNIFINKFPELGILHLPSFMQELQTTCHNDTRTLLAAILSVTHCYFKQSNLVGLENLLSREEYASYARGMLAHSSFQAPRLQVAQALLVMGLFEWGSREFHRAWIYCGIAIRIMQAINSLHIAPYPADPQASGNQDPSQEAINSAVQNRTMWACFIMERLISSGTYNPPMLPLSEMEKIKVLRPFSAVEFAFGTDSTSQRSSMVQSLATLQNRNSHLLDITQAFEVLVAGFDIWTHVMTFVLNDGRRAPEMCAPRNCPWVPGSPWSNTRERLVEWRANQHHRLHYPQNSVVAHITLGYGESFTYVNLIYYLCTVMLHREYFPFLPTSETVPRGPVDHPRLQAEAPPGWWDRSALEMFGATEHIARILHEAAECGSELLTPFVGFCAFSAAYMNLYVSKFPQMNLGRSPQAEQNLQYCLAYLEGFRHEWKLGESWMTTIKHASLLYERASSDRARYQGKSRKDFDILHQSIHEFRVVDRSHQYIQEIEGAERATDPSTSGTTPMTNTASDSLDLDAPLNDLLTEVSTYAHEQGMWSHWWPSQEEMNVLLFPDSIS